MNFTVEYSEEKESLSVRLDYDGEEKNPMTACDEISRKLIENAVSEYKHEYKEKKNLILMTIQGGKA